MRYTMKTKHALTFLVLFAGTNLLASDATTRSTTSLLTKDGTGNKGGNICPMVSSRSGYDCGTGTGCGLEGDDSLKDSSKAIK